MQSDSACRYPNKFTFLARRTDFNTFNSLSLAVSVHGPTEGLVFFSRVYLII